MTGSRCVAALDCGTNSTRLLIADADARTIERLLTITRLGQGVDATGRLAPEAIERTIDVLRRYRAVMDRHGVKSARLVATSAARDASNYPEFYRLALDATGVEPELLDGSDEGALSFLGATAGLEDAEPRLVVDIGGGSTELVAGIPGEIPDFTISLDMGCVRLTEKFLRHDPPLSGELVTAQLAIRSLLDTARIKAVTEYRSGGFSDHELIGVAGTVTALSAMSLSLTKYDPARVHHSRLSLSEVERLGSELSAETAAQRSRHRGLEQGRADVIAAGTLILGTLMGFFGLASLLVSESDILDGMVLSQLGGI